MNLKQMREKRDALKAQIDAIVNAAKGEKRDFTDAEVKDLDAKKAELRDLNTKIDAEMDKIEAEKREAEKKAEEEAEKRRSERLAALEKAQNVREERRVHPSEAAEIRVHDAFPMIGREPRAFRAVYGTENRAREEAYKSGMWILGNIFGNEEARKWSNDYGFRALNGSTNSAGAVLVPDALQNSIIWNTQERGIFARYAQNVPLGKNDSIFVPKSTGEVTIYAVSENQSDEVTESEPTFDGVELTAKTWAGLTRLGRNLADDAVINLAEYISQKFGYAHADKQDQCGFNGTGSSTYHGITGLAVKINDGTHAGSIADAASGNTGFGTLDLDDFEAAVGKAPQWMESDDPAWYISKVGYYASMARLMDAAGGNTQDNVAGGKGLQFLGYPVRITQVLNSTLGAQTSTIVALFGSLRRAAVYATKKDLEIQTLVEKYATYNQVGVLGFSRWGVNCHELGDATNAGAIVAVKTASG